MPNPPLNSLIKIEICLLDNTCKIMEDSWCSTSQQLTEHPFITVFETETKELTSRTDFRDLKFLKLPTVKKVSKFRIYTLVMIVKIGSNQSAGNAGSIFGSKTPVMDQWRAD